MNDDKRAVEPADEGRRSSEGLGVGAQDMAAMRMQAQALAFQWMAARDYRANPQGYAFFLLRCPDLGLCGTVMPGMRIRVALSFEPDA